MPTTIGTKEVCGESRGDRQGPRRPQGGRPLDGAMPRA
jgi:hypothetical protein